MTSGTYGTLHSDASPSPPKSYRLSKLAKIALALIACAAGAAVIAHPGTHPTTTNFEMEQFHGNGLSFGRSSGGAPVVSTTIEDQVQDLEARVAAIEKYLKKDKGGSGTSRGSVMMPGGLGAMARGHGARRRLRRA